MAFFRFLLVLSALLPFVVRAADSLANPIPSWVVRLSETDLPPGPDTSAGLEYLLIDKQVQIAIPTPSTFNHSTYRITTSAGLQRASEISIDYDPSYEKVSWHFLRVIRDGKTSDRLASADIKTIQQERDLDRYMYNGELTSLVMLKDVRAGDIIDYAYSISGANPIFAGNYLDVYRAGWSVPVHHAFIRVLQPAEQQIHFKVVSTSKFELNQTTSSSSSGFVLRAIDPKSAETTYTWEGRDLKRISVDNDTPEWFNPFPFIDASEFNDWASVVQWALPLYANDEAISPEMAARLKELAGAGGQNQEATVVSILDFVQCEVRYLGIEMGPASHRPSEPNEVFSRRFGDCKDKARLLCRLLNTLPNVKASPALVHSSQKQELLKRLPSPYAFDHVIVRIELGGKTYWVDPTMSYQRGDLTQRTAPDYGPALVISPETKALVDMYGDKKPAQKIHTVEVFDLSDRSKPASLQVITTYTGASASGMRSYLINTSLEEISKGLINYYARVYPGISEKTQPVWKDDESANLIQLEENYLITDIWKSSEKKDQLEVYFSPAILQNYTLRPDTPLRTSPLAISYPVDVASTTTVKLHSPWPIENEQQTVETDQFHFARSASHSGRVVTLAYEWRTKKDHVTAAATAAYAAKLKEVRDVTSYALYYTPPATLLPPVSQPSHLIIPNWTFIIGISSASVISLLIVLLSWQIKPARSPAGAPPLLPGKKPEAEPIAGFLTFVTVVLILRPLFFLIQFLSNHAHFFDRQAWLTAIGKSAERYHFLRGPALLMDGYVVFSLFLLGIPLLFLFFQRRRAFVGLMVFTLALNALYNLADFALFGLAASDFATSAAITSLLYTVLPALWLAYFLASKRVKATFTR